MRKYLQPPVNPTLGKRRSDDDLGKDQSIFIINKHLIFSPPERKDIGLNDDATTTPFVVSENFPLFSAAAIEKMRGELFTDEIQQVCSTFQEKKQD